MDKMGSDPPESNNVLPVNRTAPTITIKGETWTYISADKILVSNNQSDKEFMIMMLKKWDDEQHIR